LRLCREWRKFSVTKILKLFLSKSCQYKLRKNLEGTLVIAVLNQVIFFKRKNEYYFVLQHPRVVGMKDIVVPLAKGYKRKCS